MIHKSLFFEIRALLAAVPETSSIYTLPRIVSRALLLVFTLTNANAGTLVLDGVKIETSMELHKNSESNSCGEISDKQHKLLVCFKVEKDFNEKNMFYTVPDDFEEFGMPPSDNLRVAKSCASVHIAHKKILGIFSNGYEAKDVDCCDAQSHPNIPCYRAQFEYKQSKRNSVIVWIEYKYITDGATFGGDNVTQSGKDWNSLTDIKRAIRAKELEWVNKAVESIKISEITPSFNCTQAHTLIEQAICDDAHLSSLDAALAANYKQARAENTGAKRQQLLGDQRAWLKQRNICKTAECLSDSYTHRIDELCASISGSCKK
jgi:uncharacterized protein YecT (DUF1311 family)